MVYARFSQRFMAALIDTAIFLSLYILLGKAVSIPLTQPPVLFSLLLSVTFMLTEAGMISSTYRATPGRLVVGIEVTDLAGGRLSFPRALLRSLIRGGLGLVSPFLPYAVFQMINLIWLPADLITFAMTPKKQTIRDLVSRAVVVNRLPRTETV